MSDKKPFKTTINSPEFQKIMKNLREWKRDKKQGPFRAVLKGLKGNKVKLEISGIDINRLTEAEWRLMRIEDFPTLMAKVKTTPREISGIQYRALIDKKNPYATANFMFLELKKSHHPYNWKRPEDLSHIPQLKRAQVAAVAMGITDAKKFLSRIKMAQRATRKSAGKALTGKEMSWIEKMLPEYADWMK